MACLALSDSCIINLLQVFRLALSAYDEPVIAAALERVQGAVSPHGEVSIGSYPVTGSPPTLVGVAATRPVAGHNTEPSSN
jgi:hypothetical protein